MNSNFILVKTPHSPEGLEDALELDADPAFKAEQYESLAAVVFHDMPWKIEVEPIRFEATDAGLFITCGVDLAPDQVQALAIRALELGAVLMNAETAEIVPLGPDLEGLL